MVIFQMRTFWVSILAYCSLGEKLIPIELFAMAICFAGMVTITLSGKNQTDEEMAEEVE